MFYGCGFTLIWSKKSSSRSTLEGKPIYVPCIIEGIEEYPCSGEERATVVRFHKPSQIRFRRSPIPSPKTIVMGNLASNTREE